MSWAQRESEKRDEYFEQIIKENTYYEKIREYASKHNIPLHQFAHNLAEEYEDEYSCTIYSFLDDIEDFLAQNPSWISQEIWEIFEEVHNL